MSTKVLDGSELFKRNGKLDDLSNEEFEDVMIARGTEAFNEGVTFTEKIREVWEEHGDTLQLKHHWMNVRLAVACGEMTKEEAFDLLDEFHGRGAA